MKKVFLSLLAMTFAAISFTSCEDVPAPYLIFNGGDTPEAGTYLSESFASDFGSFTPVAVNAEGFSWQIKSFSSGSWAVGTGYDNSARVNKASEAYLVSSDIDLSQSSEAYLQFEYVLAYANNPGDDKVFITDNYTDDPTTTTWEDITGTLQSSSDFTPHTYKQAIPSQYIGKSKVRIAFYFTGTDTGSKTWEIKDVLVKEGSASGDDPQPTGDTWKVVKSISSGDYIIAARAGENNFVVATPLGADKTYGYLSTASTTLTDKSTITAESANLFTFTAVDNGYTIQDASGRYLISNATKNNFDVNATMPETGAVWTVRFNELGAAVITNAATGKTIQYSAQYTSYGEYDNITNSLPYLFNAAGDGSVIEEGTVDPTPGPTPTPSGDNLLVNGDFESWTNGLPDHWKPSSTAGGASLSQSTSAHGGSYAVEAAVASSGNKRLAYEEITLKAGTYTADFFVKAAGSDGASINKGYVKIENGAISGAYVYDGYVNDITTDWQEVSYSFTLQSETTICLVVMIPKNSKSNVIIDDFSLSTSDGGLVDGNDPTPEPQPTPTGAIFAETFANGQGAFTIDNVTLPSALTYIWNAGSYQNDKFMKASAYKSNTNYESESWLISPEVDLTNATTAKLSFEQAINAYFGNIDDEAMVYAKKAGGQWTKLTISHPTKPASGYTSFEGTVVDISAFTGGKMQFAFVYKSTSNSAGAWEVKNVVVD